MRYTTNVSLLIFSIVFFISCTNDKHEVATYLDAKQELAVKKELCRYMEKLPPKIKAEDRWRTEVEPYYERKAQSMKLLRYYKGEDGYEYFYITRIVPSIRPGERRAAAGRFQWEGNKIKNLEEFFLSTIRSEEELDKSTDELFDEAVEKHKIEDASLLPLIEWPNEYFAYDKEEHSWDRRQFIRDTTAAK